MVAVSESHISTNIEQTNQSARTYSGIVSGPIRGCAHISGAKHELRTVFISGPVFDFLVCTFGGKQKQPDPEVSGHLTGKPPFHFYFMQSEKSI